ncbi:S9 family peptidase [Neptuniibacter marinus]|uniref:S9 family peptidase n=1 Tax=Neptuniibacter marinus TaxID=1806670 RepID=UPI00082A135D|nr:prolyl oligopeptidase family serine peptidase [Neptuniibacter marinus]
MLKVGSVPKLNAKTRSGFWSTELNEQRVVSANVEYSQLRCSFEGVPYWVELRPDDRSRCVLCYEKEGVIVDITPTQYSVRSKVHEYGGQSWCFVDDGIIFTNEHDQQLYLQKNLSDSLSSCQQITAEINSRFIEPVWDQHNRQVIAVEEQHNSDNVINRLVAISLTTGKVRLLHEGYSFYSYPALNPQKNELAFIAWNHPFQPWISTELVSLQLKDLAVSVMAGQVREEALSQPLYCPDGQLYVVSDRDGWWNIYRYDALNGALEPHLSSPQDMISAPWQSGLRHYACTDSGISHLLIAHEGSELYHQGCRVKKDTMSYFHSLQVSNGKLYAIASSLDRLDAVIEVNESLQFRRLTGGGAPLDKTDCSEPKARVFGSGKDRCYGYLYSAKNHRYTESEESAPLVVFLHGGPTAASYPVLNLKIQYWTQRGFSVLDLNYRGSSNYGRSYRLALEHAWGDIEVNDISLAVTSLVNEGVADPSAVFIRGNSSGGYSALNALCQLDLFTAGASLYGVTDPAVLNDCTHKFESHYLGWLIGDPIVDAERYRSLSPIYHAADIESPVIFFQGEKDKVVLPEQTRAMVAELKGKGVDVEAHYFSDEGHGFRQKENVVHVLAEELRFYRKYLP